jgi:peptidoglycan hydrolase FlgJ
MTQIAGLSSATAAMASLPQGSGGVAASDERAQLAQAAKAFEAIFMRQMLSTMRQASLGEDISASASVEQFQELSDARLAESLAGKGNLGIADLILQQLEKKS